MKERLVILEAKASHEAWTRRALQEMPDVHPNRRSEWALARQALQEAFEQEGIVLKSDCVFDGYQKVSGLDEWRFSLSHSKDAAAAWIVKTTHAIGLDIERLSREVKPEIVTRMRHADDVKMDALSLWCLKEAAYKSLPPALQSKIWLNNIAIKDGVFKIEATEGRWLLEASQTYVMGKAYLSP